MTHITVKQRGQLLRPIRCPTDATLFTCPFCTTDVYKPRQYHHIMTHLAGHKLRAVEHGDQVIYSCNLGCNKKTRHFHCCQCPNKTFMNKSGLKSHLCSTHPITTCTRKPQPVVYLLQFPSQQSVPQPPPEPPSQKPADLAAPPENESKQISVQCLPRHITLKQRGQVLRPKRCPTDANLFTCPFCTTDVYKPTQYHHIMTHLAGHKLRAIEHGDQVIYSCSLGCDKKPRHFHCCQCPKTFINKNGLKIHLSSIHPITTSTREPQPVDPLPPSQPPAPHSLELAAPPEDEGQQISVQCLPKHITIQQKGQAPRPKRCPTDATLFTCPFCTTDVYKPKEYHQIMTHLAGHKLRAVEHGDQVMYSCNLGCNKKTRHFHCCQCPKIFVNKAQLKRHLYSAHPITTCTPESEAVIDPLQEPPSQLSDPDSPDFADALVDEEISEQCLDRHITILQKGRAPRPKRCPTDATLFTCPFCTTDGCKPREYHPIMTHLAEHKQRAVEHGDQVMYDCNLGCENKTRHFHCCQCPKTCIQKRDIQTHLSRAHPINTFTSDPQPALKMAANPVTVTRKRISVQCPHCGISLNLKNLKKHIERKHCEVEHPITHLNSAHPITTCTPESEPVIDPLQEPPSPLSDPDSPDLADALVDEEISEQCLDRRITILQRGQAPQPKSCPTDATLFACPFCTTDVYKPREYHQIMTHLAEHKQRAVEHGDQVMYDCNLGCENKARHFHCCQCPKTCIKKRDIKRHLSRAHPINTFTSDPQPALKRAANPVTVTRKRISVQCPHCGISLNSRNLKKHIERKHCEVEHPITHLYSAHPITTCTPESELVIDPLQEPPSPLSDPDSPDLADPLVDEEISEQCLDRHITILQRGQAPQPKCCPTDATLFACPFCTTDVYQPREYHHIMTHLAEHKQRAVEHGDQVMYDCNLGCENKARHFHCCQCPKTCIQISDIQRHLRSAHPINTLTSDPQPAVDPRPLKMAADQVTVARKRISVQCPHCRISLNLRNLKKHIERKHCAVEHPITSTLAAQCVDKRNGIYVVSKSFSEPFSLIHVAKKIWGSSHKVMCGMDVCIRQVEMAQKNDLLVKQCVHLSAVDNCDTVALTEDLAEDVLTWMVKQKCFENISKNQCLQQQSRAVSEGATFASLVTIGESNNMFHVSIYEPTVSHYSKLGRVLVGYNAMMDSWHCPCCSARTSCLHVSIAKWCLYQMKNLNFKNHPEAEIDLEIF